MSGRSLVLGIGAGLVTLAAMYASTTLVNVDIEHSVAFVLVLVAGVYVAFAFSGQAPSPWLVVQTGLATIYVAAAVATLLFGHRVGAIALMLHAVIDAAYIASETPAVPFGYARFCAVFDVIVASGLLLMRT